MQLKVAVVGAGSMGLNHLRVLKDLDGEQMQLVGVAETHESTLQYAVHRFHVKGYADYRRMVEETRPDLVAVVVPTHLHFEVAFHLLDQGINVLIEKPITSTVDEALALIQLASLRGAKIAVGHIERFNPAIIQVKRRLVAGELGQIFHLHARRLGPFPPRIRDVGVTLDLATHDIDIMRYLADAEVDRVYAETQRRIHNAYEDLLLGILRFSNDAIGMLDVNWLTPTKVRELSITGEKGMYLVNYLTQEVYFYENDYTPTTWDALRTLTGVSEGTMTRFKIQKAEPLRLEYENVIAAICNDTAPIVTGEDGLAALRIALQLTMATHQEEAIKIENESNNGTGSVFMQNGRSKSNKELEDIIMQNISPSVAVIGLGKIGLPLAVQFAQHGRRVIGCDINPQVVERINAGQSHIREEPELATEVPRLVHEKLLSATVNTTEAVRRADVVVVIVPVVVNEKHEVDFAAIDAATAAIGAGLQPGTLVIYEATLPVGTTAGRFARLLERTSNLQTGSDFHLAYSPERVSSGYIFRDLRIYPKVVGGTDEQSTRAAVAFYRSVLDADIITMASTDEAEFVKLIETTYRDVNIALANEFACFADAHGLDVAAAIAAANTQPYSHIHTPGIGVGGHCIPVYPYFLLASLKDRHVQIHDSKFQMLMLPRYARRINDAMAGYAVHRIEAITGPLTNRFVLILGVSYRGDVHEAAFTSTKLLQNALLEKEATVYIDDPLFSPDELRALGYNPLTPKLDNQIHAIILQASHQAYQSLDFSRFSRCQVVLDGRGALCREQIEALGMRYITIGDGYCEKAKSRRGEQQVISSALFERGQ